MVGKIIKNILRAGKLLSIAILGVVVLFVMILIIGFIEEQKENKTTEKSDSKETVFLIQPWQLNSRYKINNVVKFLKVDLDKDGKDELAVITSYDKMEPEVFYYAEFYRYNPVTEMWDEFYGEELNILNYGLTDTSKIENIEEFNQKIINMWSTEFTTLENIGDVTGDGCPEILFSSLIQGKYLDNNIIIAQAGESHYRFRIFNDQNTMAKIMAEDGMIIEKYSDDKNDIKDIYEWDSNNMFFKLIERQKEKIVIPETPKIDPGMEELIS